MYVKIWISVMVSHSLSDKIPASAPKSGLNYSDNFFSTMFAQHLVYSLFLIHFTKACLCPLLGPILLLGLPSVLSGPFTEKSWFSLLASSKLSSLPSVGHAFLCAPFVNDRGVESLGLLCYVLYPERGQKIKWRRVECT